MKKYLFVFTFMSLIFINSCAVLDMPARFLGISNQKFYAKDAAKFEEIFDMNKKNAFERTISIIDFFDARVVRKSFKKGYIVAFNFSQTFDFCLDSTEVGFFIEEIDEGKVNIAVVTNNSLLAKNLSQAFFKVFSSTQDFVNEGK